MTNQSTGDELSVRDYSPAAELHAGPPRATEETPASNGGAKLLRRWSVAELIARATVRPPCTA
jgi:hypothetical protein